MSKIFRLFCIAKVQTRQNEWFLKNKWSVLGFLETKMPFEMNSFNSNELKESRFHFRLQFRKYTTALGIRLSESKDGGVQEYVKRQSWQWMNCKTLENSNLIANRSVDCKNNDSHTPPIELSFIMTMLYRLNSWTAAEQKTKI